MEELIISVLSLILLVPILYFLPIGITNKGKGLLVVIALVFANIAFLAKETFPFWQTVLILLLLSFLIVYLLDKRMGDFLYQSVNKKTMDIIDEDEISLREVSAIEVDTESGTGLDSFKSDGENSGINHEEIIDRESSFGAELENSIGSTEVNDFEDYSLQEIDSEETIDSFDEWAKVEEQDEMEELNLIDEFDKELSEKDELEGLQAANVQEEILNSKDWLEMELDDELDFLANREVLLDDEIPQDGENIHSTNNEGYLSDIADLLEQDNDINLPELEESISSDEDLIEIEPFQFENKYDAPMEENEEDIFMNRDEMLDVNEGLDIEDDDEDWPTIELDEELTVQQTEKDSTMESLDEQEDLEVEDEEMDTINETIESLVEELEVEEESEDHFADPSEHEEERETALEQLKEYKREVTATTAEMATEIYVPTGAIEDFEQTEAEDHSEEEFMGDGLESDLDDIPAPVFSEEDTIRQKNQSILRQQLFHTMISELQIARGHMKASEYEELIKEYLHPHLPNQDYYTFAHLLIEHYISQKEWSKLEALLTNLNIKFTDYPILDKEIEFLYKEYCEKVR